MEDQVKKRRTGWAELEGAGSMMDILHALRDVVAAGFFYFIMYLFVVFGVRSDG